MVAVATEVGIVELNNNGRVFVVLVLVLMSSPSSHIASNFGVTSPAQPSPGSSLTWAVAWSLFQSPLVAILSCRGLLAAVAAVYFT
jgi:hypothetical protein